jgi:ribosomal-protein-alanine N-acetyltransferase
MLRAAISADIAVLSALHLGAFSGGWDAAALAALLEGPGVFAILSESDVAEGFILMRVAADEAEILTLAVGKEHRRHGIASRLLEQASGQSALRGARRMFLEVSATNHAAASLYQGHGFERVGRRKAYYEDGADAWVLSATLPLRMGKSGKTL